MFQPGQRVRILAEPYFDDDPKPGAVGVVFGPLPPSEYEVVFPNGDAVPYRESELELAE